MGDRQYPPVHPKRISFPKVEASSSMLSCLEQPSPVLLGAFSVFIWHQVLWGADEPLCFEGGLDKESWGQTVTVSPKVDLRQQLVLIALFPDFPKFPILSYISGILHSAPGGAK